MRRLIWILGIVAVVWTLWWGGFQQVLKHSVVGQLVSQREGGMMAHVSDFEVTGYPLSFDTNWHSLSISDESGANAFDVGAFSARMPAWWPGDVVITMPETDIRASVNSVGFGLIAEKTTAVLNTRPSLSLEVERVDIRSTKWRIEERLGRLIDGDMLHIVLHQDEQSPSQYAVNLDTDAVSAGDLLRTQLGIPRDWAYTLEDFTLSGVAGFDAPLSRHSLAQDMPQPRDIEISQASIIWGDLSVEAHGKVTLDDTATPEGELRLFIGNWRLLYPLMQASGLPQQADLVLNALANIGGDPETMDLTVLFAGGQMSVGGIPLGPAPRFIMR